MIGVLRQKKTCSLNCARKIILGSKLQETRPLQQKAEYNTTSRRDDGRLQVKEMMAFEESGSDSKLEFRRIILQLVFSMFFSQFTEISNNSTKSLIKMRDPQ